MPNFIKGLSQFLGEDIWRIRVRKIPRTHSLLIRTLRVFLLSLTEFKRDLCNLRASSLTFYTLLSIVPVLATMFGIAKGFGMELLLEQWLIRELRGQEEVLARIIYFANTMLQNTSGGIIAGIGVGFLLWSVIQLLQHIEEAFNQIWGVTAARSWSRKFSDYLSLIMICPIFLVVASSTSVLVISHLQGFTQNATYLGVFNKIIVVAIALVPYVIFWLLLTFLYRFMPNTHVRFSSAFLAAVVAGTLYQLVQWAYITFQIGVNRMGAIYGSFAALPLFLIWLQTSWLIVLYGAELAFAHQNEERYEYEPDSGRVSMAFKKLLALRVTQLCVQNFSKNKNAWNAVQIAAHLDTPIRLIRLVIHELVLAGVLLPTKVNGKGDEGYVPAFDTDDIKVQTVLSALEHNGIESIPLAETGELKALRVLLENIEDQALKSNHNISLKSLGEAEGLEFLPPKEANG